MMAHLEQTRHSKPEWERGPSSWPAFDDWMVVNRSRAEVLAGQHRVEALKLYLRRISSNHSGAHAFEKDQSWWICDIYDKGEDRRLLNRLGLKYHQIDFQHSSASSYVLTARALYCQTAMDRFGWNWQH
jgi:hypothetical protein